MAVEHSRRVADVVQQAERHSIGGIEQSRKRTVLCHADDSAFTGKSSEE
jgi:hypothetical protein